MLTRALFDGQMARLSVLPGMPSSVDEHWRVVRALDPGVLEAATTRALATRKFFPVPSELREDYDAVVLERLRHVDDTVHVRDKPWVSYCDQCDDTGWIDCWCGPVPEQGRRKAWAEIRTCQHTHDHPAHEYVRECPCAETNPAIQRRKAKQVQQAADRTRRRSE
jgi:hypothetical protein